MDGLYDYAPPRPEADPRTMLPHHVMARGVERMRQADQRRDAIATSEDWQRYQDEVLRAIRAIYADLPVGPDRPVEAKTISTHDLDGCRIENVLFDSQLDWHVNASCIVPTDSPALGPMIVAAYSMEMGDTGLEPVTSRV